MNAVEALLGIMIGIPVAIAMGMFYLVRGAGRLIAKAFAAGAVEVTAGTAIVNPSTGGQTVALALAATTAIGQVANATVPVGPSALRSVADKHVLVVFNDNFTASVSSHPAENLVRRKLRAIKAPAAELMKHLYLKEVFDLPDVELTPGVTFEQAVLDTEAIGKQFIEELLSAKEPQYFQFAPALAKSNAISTPVDPAEAARALALLRVAVHAAEDQSPAAVVPAVPEGQTRVVQSKRRTQEITTGVVADFGMKKMFFQSKIKTQPDKPGETFEVIIDLGNGEQAALRGVVLQEKFREQDVRVGDHVEIHSLGKTKVTIDGETKNRNEFEVKILERA